MSTHILVIITPLIELLGRRKQWNQPWLSSGWAPWEMGREILAHHWPWVIGSLSCVPERTTGNHKPWSCSCGDNFLRGYMTVVVELFPNGCLPVSVGQCLSWPSARGNLPGSVCAAQGDASTSWLSVPAWAATATLYSFFLMFEDMFMSSWDIGTLTLARASHQANKWPLKWSWLLTENNIYTPATNTLCLSDRFTYLDMSWCLQPQPHPRSLPPPCWHNSSQFITVKLSTQITFLFGNTQFLSFSLKNCFVNLFSYLYYTLCCTMPTRGWNTVLIIKN